MKQFAILTLLGIFFLSCSQTPSAVQKSFAKLYPDAKDLQWSKENEFYEASFTNDNKKMSVLLNYKGDILETEIEMEEIPEPLKAYVSTKFPNEKIHMAAQITRKNQDVQYEIELDSKELFFQNNFQLIKEVENDENE